MIGDLSPDRATMPASVDDRPTLLMLGSGEPMRAALESALARHAAFAEVADASSPVAAVMASAPDLVVLVGDAAAAYEELLPKFAQHPMTAVVPIALLAPADLEVHLSTARRGVALVPRTASADEMVAKRIPLAVHDVDGALVALFRDQWEVDRIVRENDDWTFLETKPIRAAG